MEEFLVEIQINEKLCILFVGRLNVIATMENKGSLNMKN